MIYESQEAKRLYDYANRLGTADRERQALMGFLQADKSTHKSDIHSEFTEGDDSQPLDVNSRRKHENSKRCPEQLQVRIRSLFRGRQSRPDK